MFELYIKSYGTISEIFYVYSATEIMNEYILDNESQDSHHWSRELYMWKGGRQEEASSCSIGIGCIIY